MKRFLACFLILLVVGCGSKPTDESAKSSLADSQIVQNSEDTKADLPDGLSLESDQPNRELATSLQQLVNSANAFETKKEFRQAAQIWSQVVDQLTQEFGPQSWQPANAKLAYQTAMIQDGFDARQSLALEQIADLQRQMKSAANQNETRIAAGLASQSVNQTSQLFGPHSAVTAKQRIQLAKFLRSLPQTSEAVFQFEQALADLLQNFATTHPDLCHIHDYLGDLYLNGSNYPASISHLSAAAQMSAAIWGDDSTQYATRANQLGVAYYQSGQQDVALKVLQAAEVIRRRKLGADDIQVAHSLTNIGNVMIQTRQPADAIVQLNKAKTIYASHENLALQYDEVNEKLATAYMLNDQPDMAEPLLASRLEKARKTLPEHHPDVASIEYRYAIALGRQGKYELAEPAIRNAISANQKNYGPRHSETVNSYQAYAMLLQRTNREQEAQKLLEQLRVAQNPGNNSFQR